MTMTARMPQVAFANVGIAIPDDPHAVSVSLPSWKANVGYEEGEDWVISKMKNGYPRFFIHLSIAAFSAAIVKNYGKDGEEAMLFPSHSVSLRCLDFLKTLGETGRVLDFVLKTPQPLHEQNSSSAVAISSVLYSKQASKIARQFWQHSGEGISSRRAEFFFQTFQEGHLVPREHAFVAKQSPEATKKGPKRYQRGASLDKTDHITIPSSSTDRPQAQDTVQNKDHNLFVEERFGRNLNISLAARAKVAIRRRIAGTLTNDGDLQEDSTPEPSSPARGVRGFSVDDVYLFPTGMSAIYNSHRCLLKIRGALRSVDYGFPYIDTLKVLEKFGPGCLFYGHGSSEDLDDLEKRLKKGEKYLALYCEFPGNPLLTTPDLHRIRKLADKYDFAVVVDETIGNFLNIHVLPAADIVVSSLTKVFSGDSNVMGGSLVLNPKSRYYDRLRTALADDYEDTYWPEDSIYMERNSRDFLSRNERINKNTEATTQLLNDSPYTKKVYYPKTSADRSFYDAFRNSDGGYGGLFSITFHSMPEAVAFFDALQTAKGPSLGTNFTLCCPFVILAHYNELDWAASYGAEADLVRVSVGLEDTAELLGVFQQALDAIAKLRVGAVA